MSQEFYPLTIDVVQIFMDPPREGLTGLPTNYWCCSNIYRSPKGRSHTLPLIIRSVWPKHFTLGLFPNGTVLIRTIFGVLHIRISFIHTFAQRYFLQFIITRWIFRYFKFKLFVYRSLVFLPSPLTSSWWGCRRTLYIGLFHVVVSINAMVGGGESVS